MAGSCSVLISVVAADLGNSPKLVDKKQASVVIGIVDGIGSIGAAIGQSVIPRVKGLGWEYYFVLLSSCVACAQVLLLFISKREMKSKRN